jgi:two-component system, NtrC family, sensor kinase
MTDDSQASATESPRQDAGIERLIAIGRSAGTVAHKVNNNLTSILTFAHLLRDKANMDEQDREDLDLIVREAMQAATMVRNLQDFTREPVL